ncbi:37243_t:CDS:1, partial [Gigaspora margarita]
MKNHIIVIVGVVRTFVGLESGKTLVDTLLKNNLLTSYFKVKKAMADALFKIAGS